MKKEDTKYCGSVGERTMKWSETTHNNVASKQWNDKRGHITMWQGGATIMDKVIDGNIDPPHPLWKDYPLENLPIKLFQHLQDPWDNWQCEQ